MNAVRILAERERKSCDWWRAVVVGSDAVESVAEARRYHKAIPVNIE